MTTHVTRGKGKLYEVSGEKLVSEVNYQIHEELTTEGKLEKWWGELTLVDNIRIQDGDKYVIELEDKRKGRCLLRRRVNKAVISVPPRFFYWVQNTGPLK